MAQGILVINSSCSEVDLLGTLVLLLEVVVVVDVVLLAVVLALAIVVVEVAVVVVVRDGVAAVFLNEENFSGTFMLRGGGAGLRVVS